MSQTTPKLLSKLRVMVADMEKDLGLAELCEASRLLYCAAIELSDGGEIRTSDLRKHALLREVSRPTFFRALSELIELKYLKRSETDSRGTVYLADR
jgi:hypothetical protein